MIYPNGHLWQTHGCMSDSITARLSIAPSLPQTRVRQVRRKNQLISSAKLRYLGIRTGLLATELITGEAQHQKSSGGEFVPSSDLALKSYRELSERDCCGPKALVASCAPQTTQRVSQTIILTTLAFTTLFRIQAGL